MSGFSVGNNEFLVNPSILIGKEDVIYEKIQLGHIDLVELKKQNEELRQELNELKEMYEELNEKFNSLWYSPGNPGYHDAKMHFYKTALESNI